MLSDLTGAQQQMQVANVKDGEYPSVLPAGVKSSPHVTLTLAGGGQTRYENLTPSQNGLLFFDTCAQLISEGVGAKPDDNHDYISGCTVFNKNQVHVEGWNGRDIATPLTTSSLSTYVTSYSGGSRDDFLAKGQHFMDVLATRFAAAGGTFPVTQFWDNWATPTNGGVVKPTLPAPTQTGNTDTTSFCIEATYDGRDITKHIRETGGAVDGSCA
jgi:hypothetical protein